MSGWVPHFSPILGEVGILTLREQSSQFARMLQHQARIAGFVAVLDQRATASHQLLGEIADLVHRDE